MDWKVFATAFGAVFLAELGDKTQLAALALAGDSRKPWSVFAGAALALVLVTALGVAAGEWLGRKLPQRGIEIASAVLFLVIGAYLLFKALHTGAPDS